jgi:hypothetical protein
MYGAPTRREPNDERVFVVGVSRGSGCRGSIAEFCSQRDRRWRRAHGVWRKLPLTAERHRQRDAKEVHNDRNSGGSA